MSAVSFLAELLCSYCILSRNEHFKLRKTLAVKDERGCPTVVMASGNEPLVCRLQHSISDIWCLACPLCVDVAIATSLTSSVSAVHSSFNCGTVRNKLYNTCVDFIVYYISNDEKGVVGN